VVAATPMNIGVGYNSAAYLNTGEAR